MKQFLYPLLIAFLAIITSSDTFAQTYFTVEVYDNNNEELSGAKVELIKDGATLIFATTDRWGECEIETTDNLTGDYQLRASCKGYSTQTMELTLPTETGSFTFNLTSTSAILSLTVKEDGESQWYWEGAHCVLSLDGKTVAETTTGSYSMGMCELKIATPDESRDYLLTVSKEGYITVTKDIRLKAGERQELTITLYKEGTEPPADETTVSGNVYEEGNWSGIEGATVTLLDNGTTLGTTATDSAGDFILTIDRLLEGSYTLTVTAEGFKEASRTISIEGGESKSNDIGLTKAETEATLFGEVKDSESGRSITGATLSIYQDNSLLATATSEAWVGYSLIIPAVNDKDYTLTVQAEGYKDWTDNALHLTEGQNVLNIEMKKNQEQPETTIVKGTVINTSGSAISGAKVSLYRAEERLDYEFTDDEGNYEITINEKLDGNFTLTVNKDGYKETSVEITITAGEAPATEIIISKSTAILKATVKSKETDKPVAGATLILEYAWEEVARATTNADGQCEITIDGTTTDAYQLSISAPNYLNYTEDLYLSDGENLREFIIEPKGDGIAAINAGNLTISSAQHELILKSEGPVFVEIFKADGIKAAAFTVKGEKSIRLQNGLFVIRADGATFKINM